MTRRFALALLLALCLSPNLGRAQHEHGHAGDLARYIAEMEEPGREAWQKPDEVIAALKLGKDSVVCDVGVGPGYFALRLAPKVAQVYGVDVEPGMLDALRERIA